MEEKIKDIYKCKSLDGNDSLVIWHNQVIEKKAEELTIADVARCIRQNLFTEIAYEVLLAYLLNNPYAGDLYEGELMDKASKVDKELISKHKSTIQEIIEKANTFIKTYEWLCEEDKIEFTDSVNELKEKIV